MRLGGTSEASMEEGLVTAEALSSIATWRRSLGSRTRSTSVSTISWGSTLKEYCTVEKSAWTANSRRERTQSAEVGSAEKRALGPASTNPGLSVNVVRPRDTSKSSVNRGLLGMRAKASAISFWSSADGEQTLSILTFTCGWSGFVEAGGWSCDGATEPRPKNKAKTRIRFRVRRVSTSVFYRRCGELGMLRRVPVISPREATYNDPWQI